MRALVARLLLRLVEPELLRWVTEREAAKAAAMYALRLDLAAAREATFNDPAYAALFRADGAVSASPVDADGGS